MITRWTHIVFAFIWLITAIVFFRLADDAKQSQSITLEKWRESYSGCIDLLPATGPSMTEVLNGIINTHNSNVVHLEESIRASARTSFWLNFVSGFAAIFGFIAQVTEYFYAHRNKGTKKKKQPEEVL